MSKIIKQAKYTLILGILSVSCSQVALLITSQLLGTILSSNSQVELINNTSVYLLPIVIFYGISYLFKYITGYQEKRLLSQIRSNLYESYLGRYYKDSACSQGDYSELVNKDSKALVSKYTNVIPSIIGAVFYSCISLLVVKNTSIHLFVFTIFSAISYAIFPIFAKRKLEINYSKIIEIETKITNFFIENIAAHTVYLFHGKRWIQKKLASLNDEYNREGSKSELLAQASNAVNDFLNYFLKFGSAFYGLLLVNQSIIALSEFVGLYLLMNNVYSLVSSLSQNIAAIETQKQSITRITNAMKVDDNSIQKYVGSALLTLEDVSIFYGDRQVLTNVNMKIDVGDKVLLYGENGSGKSSIFKIITGEIESYVGKVHSSLLYAGNALSTRLSYVPQKTPVMKIMGEELLEIYIKEHQIESSNFKKFYDCLEGNYENLSKSFHELSSGEVKKIIMALELAKNSALVLLDEPTNYLDRRTLLALKHILLKMNRTIIIVSHDDFFSDICNKQFLIEGGEIYDETTQFS